MMDTTVALHEATRAHVSHCVEESQVRQNAAQNYKHLLSTLFFPEMTSREENIPDAHVGTFEWIFKDGVGGYRCHHNDYLSWLEKGSGIFWICGKPGSGKSTLMRYIYGHRRTSLALKKWAGNRSVVASAFFLWNPGNASLQITFSGLLRTLLYQVLCQRKDLYQLSLDSEPLDIPHWTETRLVRAAFSASQIKANLPLL